MSNTSALTSSSLLLQPHGAQSSWGIRVAVTQVVQENDPSQSLVHPQSMLARCGPRSERSATQRGLLSRRQGLWKSGYVLLEYFGVLQFHLSFAIEAAAVGSHEVILFLIESVA